MTDYPPVVALVSALVDSELSREQARLLGSLLIHVDSCREQCPARVARAYVELRDSVAGGDRS